MQTVFSSKTLKANKKLPHYFGLYEKKFMDRGFLMSDGNWKHRNSGIFFTPKLPQ